jgi:hypothetical protein
MNRVFRRGQGIVVPDGTTVYPFLNAKDSTSDLAYDLLDGFSLAAGRIAPKSSSKVHVMPFVTQVTWVISGHLDVRMKDAEHRDPYTVHLSTQGAVLTRPGTFFQLINASAAQVDVLYIVSPAYLFLADETHNVEYDDSIVFDLDWERLAEEEWEPAELLRLDLRRDARDRASVTLATRKDAATPVRSGNQGLPPRSRRVKT